MKYAAFIGRFVTFHDGHKWLIQQALDEGKQVLVMVRDTGERSYDEIFEDIDRAFPGDDVHTMQIPDIESINYGRDVGYDIIEHVPPAEIAEISGTKIRAKKGRAPIVWLTGRPGAGKTTIANEVQSWYHAHGDRLVVLDGDELRETLSADLDYDFVGRRTQAQRVAALAKIHADNGTPVVIAVVAPDEVVRAEVDRLMEGYLFTWVHVYASLETCRQRDPKGLYQGGVLVNNYQEPYNVEAIWTEASSIEEAGRRVIGLLQRG